MNQKELTAHIRNRLKAAGVQAKCKMNGSGVITVAAPAYNAQFTDEQQYQIKLIAISNRLTFARGHEINLHVHTEPLQFNFYVN